MANGKKVNFTPCQAENLQNVQKMCFWQKAPGVTGLNVTSLILKKVMLIVFNVGIRKINFDLSVMSLF